MNKNLVFLTIEQGNKIIIKILIIKTNKANNHIPVRIVLPVNGWILADEEHSSPSIPVSLKLYSHPVNPGVNFFAIYSTDFLLAFLPTLQEAKKCKRNYIL